MYKCNKCQLSWSYELERCIFCAERLEKTVVSKYKVSGVTKVLIPSFDHKKAPYNCLLLEDEFGNFHIKKTYEDFSVGDVIDHNEGSDEASCLTVAVVGTGATGSGIAQVFVEYGHKVLLKSRSESSLEACRDKIRKSLLKSYDVDEVENMISRLHMTVDYADLRYADLVIEAVSEDYELKCSVFSEIKGVVSENCIIASNTSSLSIDSLADNFDRPERFLGMHFFNPVPKMALVEVVVGERTSNAVVDQIVDLSKGISKTPIKVIDSPAFIVNRVLMVYLNEAMEALEEGIATAKEIDSASKLGLNHPMGPLELADFIGLDVVYAILNTMYEKTGRDKYLPVKILREMVDRNDLGRKTGVGFYNY